MTAQLPAGVDWTLSPLLDFSAHPRLSMLPDFIRYSILTHMTLKYSGMDKPDTQAKVLDAAAGFAELYSMLQVQYKARGCRLRYTGVDADGRKQGKAKNRHPVIDYRLANFEEKGALLDILLGETFDTVVSSETLEHLRKTAGERFVRDLFAALNPGGHLIITCPNQYSKSIDSTHQYEWPDHELISLCETQGTIVDRFYLKGRTADLRGELNTLMRVPSELLRGMPSDSGATTVLVVRKEQ